MSARRMAKNRSLGMIEARIGRCCLDDVVGCEADVLKSSRPASAPVADSPVFDVARDYSPGGEGRCKMSNMGQVVD